MGVAEGFWDGVAPVAEAAALGEVYGNTGRD